MEGARFCLSLLDCCCKAAAEAADLPALAFLNVVCILIASNLSGLGIKPTSQPSRTSRPIHHSLLNFCKKKNNNNNRDLEPGLRTGDSAAGSYVFDVQVVFDIETDDHF